MYQNLERAVDVPLLEQRMAGVLVPVFALRRQGDMGIGDTQGMKDFIDWASDQGFRVIKTLPINETGEDHSPYNAVSSVALEPAFLSINTQDIPDLTEEDLHNISQPQNKDAAKVEYKRVKTIKRQLLNLAYQRFYEKELKSKSRRAQAFQAFLEQAHDWIDEYCLFRVLSEVNGTAEWPTWNPEHRSVAAARKWLESLEEDTRHDLDSRLRMHGYIQWLASQQWNDVKRHAEARGVLLMGDIPFGVSFYSADVWAHPEWFKTEWSGGTPPDKVFEHDRFVQEWGQNWGIPLYNWEALEQSKFFWWRQRVRNVRQYFDLFRIDHVLGFYRIYGFPWRPEENDVYLNLSKQEAADRAGGRSGFLSPFRR